MENDRPYKPVPIPPEVLNDPYSWYNRDKTFKSMLILAGVVIAATFIACTLASMSDEKHTPTPKPKGAASAEPFADLPQPAETSRAPVENMT